ncbi:hypothetical protein BUALT_Bualt17G0104800 [Buddleja alternifolia]|uniref:Uncharacterized protein n=1 Tax=Buddleja alternifolia TaxID=168488 RepID=A0AAV6W881_9LAMI|nr:hypothetical protein BUALT_Bualt17G0104800 [Buddleja alternifolia]
MGKAAREQLSRALSEHLNTIHETFQMLDQTPASSLEKVSWKEVIQMGEQVSKQATTVGMLYTGETPGVKALEENMATYFNTLQGFLLLSHGSSMGAGPTLSSCIHKSVKQVTDGSFALLQEAVSSYALLMLLTILLMMITDVILMLKLKGSPNKAQKLSIPQLVGAVWEACSALKKTPSTNVTAIGRAITQVAVSMKDVLREMKELKPASSPSDEASVQAEDKSDSDDACDADLGNDLSPEEMKIVQLTISIVSDTLMVIKELIRSITALLQQESCDGSAVSVDSLEKLLKLCQGIGVQVDELGACLYPPQEISAIKVALEKISSFTSDTEVELGNLKGFSGDFGKACTGLRGSLRQLESQLSYVGAGDLASGMENLVVSN